jgi:hypothetical protein
VHGSYYRRTAWLAIGLLALALIVGCGGSKKRGTVSASVYVGQVCYSVATWLQSLHSRGETLNTQLSSTAPPQGKRDLENFVGLSVTDTGTVVDALRGVGAPDVSNGQKIAGDLVTSFESAKGSLARTQTEAALVATSNAKAFEAAAKQIGKSVRDVPITLASGLAAVSSPELDKAASESPVCKSVGAHVKT